MYGRNGIDQLGWALLIAQPALSFFACFLSGRAAYAALRLLRAVLAALMFYRIFSRNLTRRRAENARFLRLWTPIRTGFRDARRRRADKAHKYVRCDCGTWCRVPRGVGTVELMCPKCGERRIVKT